MNPNINSQFKSADFDERAVRKETPEDLVMALPEAKADDIMSKLQTVENQAMDAKPTILIAADTIHFLEIPDSLIESLIEEGMVLNVAGVLIIEHPLILPYVKEVVGATDSVMGLPKALTMKLIVEVL